MPPVNPVTHVRQQHSRAYWTRWAAGMLYCVDYDADPTPLLNLLVPSGQVIPTPVIYRSQQTSPLAENFIWARLPGIGVVAAFGGTLTHADLVAQFTSVRIVDVAAGSASYQTTQVWAQQAESLHEQLFNWLGQQSGFTFLREPIFCVGYSLGGVVALGVATHLLMDSQPPPLEVTCLTIAMPPPWYVPSAVVPPGEFIWRSGDIVPSLYPHLRPTLNPALLTGTAAIPYAASQQLVAFSYPITPQWEIYQGKVAPGIPPGIPTQQIVAAIRGTASFGDDHSLLRYLRDVAVDDVEDAEIVADLAAEFSLSRAIKAVYPAYVDKFNYTPPPLLEQYLTGGTWEEAPPGLVMGDLLDFLRDP